MLFFISIRLCFNIALSFGLQRCARSTDSASAVLDGKSFYITEAIPKRFMVFIMNITLSAEAWDVGFISVRINSIKSEPV